MINAPAPLARLVCLWSLLATSLCAGQPASPRSGMEPGPGPNFERTGTIRDRRLPEVSGLAAGTGSDLWVHNDDGKAAVFAVAEDGTVHAEVILEGATNVDWEDLALVFEGDTPLLVVADTGDNEARRSRVFLYFAELPERGEDGNYPADVPIVGRLAVQFPDGPRDCEAVAFDPHRRQLLLLSKRDLPPRLYAIEADQFRSEGVVVARSIGTVPTLRAPTALDRLINPGRGSWVSQPTGLDISRDGRRAAVLTYRSLYLFQRQDGEDWTEAFQRQPLEIRGPSGLHDEAVAFAPDGRALFVAGEGLPAPIYRLELAREEFPD